MFIQTQNHKKERSKEDRYWLPGPPPRRRLKGLDTLEFSYPSSLPNLHVPIRAVDLWSNDNRKSKTLAPYFQRKTLDSGTSPKPEALYLFHGCASEISPALLRSFSKYGPSIHFSRPRSYFSRTPAVYWTDSLDFAFAWCVFSETGRWLPEISSESPPFECLVYVSKVDSTILDDRNAAFLVPVPNSDASEQELVDVSVLPITGRSQSLTHIPSQVVQCQFTEISRRKSDSTTEH